MFDFIAAATGGVFNLKNYLFCIAAALLCGIIVAVAASFRGKLTASFGGSLIRRRNLAGILSVQVVPQLPQQPAHAGQQSGYDICPETLQKFS